MGQAIIQSGGPDGEYAVTLVKNTSRAAAQKTKLEARVATLTAEITAAEAAVTTAASELETANDGLNTAIADYLSGSGSRENIIAAQRAVATAAIKYRVANIYAARLKIEKASAEKALIMLAGMFVPETTGAWCADLTEDLSGTVGTIEINGEAGTEKNILIMPGGATGAGTIEPVGSSTPAGYFYAAAVFPGWQKWKPTYRLGTLTSVDEETDTCSVTLDDAVSSVTPHGQELDINTATSLSNVAIVYMDCNAAAFEAGDRVVVAYQGQDYAQPSVIGFESHPKACGQEFAIYEAYFLSLPVAVAVVWDVVNGQVAMGPVLTTNETYLAWVAKTQAPDGGDNLLTSDVHAVDGDGPVPGESLWPVEPLTNTSYNDVVHSETMCPSGEVAPSAFGTSGTYIAAKHHPAYAPPSPVATNNPESVWATVLLPDSPIEMICGLRTSVQQDSVVEQVSSCGPPLTELYSIDTAVSHTFFGPLGEMADFEGWISNSSSQIGFYNDSYSSRYIPTEGPPFDTPYYGSSFAGKYSERAIALAVMVQFTPCTKTLTTPHCFGDGCEYSIEPEVREVHVQAATRYYENGAAGNDITALTVNETLSDALEEAAHMAYEENERPDYEVRDLQIVVNIVKGPKLI